MYVSADSVQDICSCVIAGSEDVDYSEHSSMCAYYSNVSVQTNKTTMAEVDNNSTTEAAIVILYPPTPTPVSRNNTNDYHPELCAFITCSSGFASQESAFQRAGTESRT